MNTNPRTFDAEAREVRSRLERAEVRLKALEEAVMAVRADLGWIEARVAAGPRGQGAAGVAVPGLERAIHRWENEGGAVVRVRKPEGRG